MSMYDPIADWQRRGRTYEARFRQTPAFEAQEAALADVLRPLAFRSVLEVGCGFGRIGELVARIRPDARYTGLDISADMLRGARSRLPDGEFVEAALLDFDADGRQWDLVLVAEVLMHQPPDAVVAFVAAVRRLARHHVVTVDWDEPGAPRVADPGNFQHDYRDLFGPSAHRTPVGRQAIWRVPA